MTDSELMEAVQPILSADLRQDCLVALLQRRPRTADDARRVIQRVLYRHQWRRRQDRKRTEPLPEYEEPDTEQHGDDLGLAYDAVCRLPENQRRVILLRYVSGLSATQTARQLGVGRRTIHRWTNAALQTLRRGDGTLCPIPPPL